MDVYLISGLGADNSIFNRIDLPDDNCKPVHWHKVVEDETLESYVSKIALQINTAKPFVLIGLSFGGLIAIELNKIVKPVATILISSFKNKEEIPFYFRLASTWNFDKMIPGSLLKVDNPIAEWFFGVNSADEKDLFKKIISKTDAVLLKWSIGCLIRWDNKRAIPNLFHIHGDEDKLLPIRNIKADYIIKGGGHFMIWDKAKKINDVIIKIVSEFK